MSNLKLQIGFTEIKTLKHYCVRMSQSSSTRQYHRFFFLYTFTGGRSC